MHSRRSQRSKLHNKRCNSKNDQAAKSTGDHCKFQSLGSITLGTLQISLAHHISKKDTTCACNTKTENCTDITDNHNQRIGSNCICAKMPEDYRIHGKANTPGNIITEGRQGKPYKIAEQQLIFNKHISKIQPYIFTEGGNDKTCDQFHCSGKRGSNGNTDGSKFRCSEKTKDKSSV